jgi:hypothetical protein
VKDRLDIYFESIEPVFGQVANDVATSHQQPLRARALRWLISAFAGVSLVSVIPVIPGLVTFALPPTNIGPIPIGGNSVERMVPIWLCLAFATSAAAIGLFLMADALGPPSAVMSRLHSGLSPGQVSFVRAYSATRHLRMYMASHLASHLHEAHESLRMLFLASEIEWSTDAEKAEADAAMKEIYGSLTGGWVRVQLSDLPEHLKVLDRLLPMCTEEGWLELEPATLARIRALLSLRDRLLPRLELGQDLAPCLMALESLSTFLFARLPEHKEYASEGDLRDLKDECMAALDTLGKTLADLAPIHHADASRKKRRPARWSQQVFEFVRGSTSGARFIRWFALLLIVTSGVALVLRLTLGLSAEAVGTLVIPTSILGAATVTAATTGEGKL